MLNQNVVVIALGRLQRWISCILTWIGAGVWIQDLRWNDICEIRPRDSNPERSAEVRVLPDVVLQLHAGEHADIGRASVYNRRRENWVSARIKRQLVGPVGRIRCFKPESCLDAQLAEPDRIHEVARVDTLILRRSLPGLIEKHCCSCRE